MGKIEMILGTLEFIKQTAPSLEYDDQIIYYGKRIEELEELLEETKSIQEDITQIIAA